MNIDSIDLLAKNVTLDISNLNRNTLNEYFNQYIKFYASYKRDLEVLTTKQEPDYAITDSKTIQFIRYIYLLRISNCFKDKVFNFVNDVYTGKKYIDKRDVSQSKKCFCKFGIICQDTAQQRETPFGVMNRKGFVISIRSGDGRGRSR